MFELFQMWALVEVLGLLCLPLTITVFHNLPDRGWAFSKALAMLVFAFCVWFPLMTLRFLPFSQLFLLGVALLALVGGIVGLSLLRQDIVELVRRNLTYVITCEVLFLGMVFLLGWLRSFRPDIYTNEMFMDEGFIAGIMRSPHFPPNDMWLSGYGLNYYYYAHFTIAALAKLIGQAPAVAFNTGISIFFGLTAVALFGVTCNVVAWARHLRAQANKPGRRVAAPAEPEMLRPDRVYPALSRAMPYGFLSMLMGLILGNLASTQQWFIAHGDPAHFDWYAPSRVITMLVNGQPAPTTINEFPAFSFLLACFHAHVLALAFTIVAIGLAFSLFLEEDGKGLYAFGRGWRLVCTLVAAALLLGALFTMNGWDYPTYIGLALVCIALQQWLAYKQSAAKEAASERAQGIALGHASQGNKGDPSPSIATAPPINNVSQPEYSRGDPLRSPGELRSPEVARSSAGVVVADVEAAEVTSPGRRWQGAFVLDVVIAGACLVLPSFLLYLPFYLTFVSPAQGIGLVDAKYRSNIGQELLIYGLFGFVFISLLLASAAKQPLSGRLQGMFNQSTVLKVLTFLAVASLIIFLFVPNSVTFVVIGSIAVMGTLLLFYHLGDRAHAFTLLLGALAFALVAFCEVVYLRDVFDGGDYLRMNTVFKFYFQAWALLSIACGSGLYFIIESFRPFKLASQVQRWSLRVGLGLWSVVLGLFLLAGSVYPLMAPVARYAQYNPNTQALYWQRSNSLDGLAYLANCRPPTCQYDLSGDYGAIRWLNANVQGDPVIVEALGDDYTSYDRVSAFTGLPTIFGWAGHEEQWRINWLNRGSNASDSRYNSRAADIDLIYTNPDPSQVLATMARYHAQYLYVGALEYVKYTQQKYPRLDLHRFSAFMQTVYSANGVVIYKVPA
ncbi:MAG TPA: DUF2298 domain-containing protein [Ktedonosporobacter sp.]|nr:DUF2298 domain-containing protein [Ktedonosporobacter sp.]